PGTTSRTATTTGGCAIFSALPVGTYDVQVSKAGYMDPAGSAAPTQTGQGVFAGQVTDVAFTYDRWGTFTATFFSYANGARFATQADRLTVTNASMGAARKFGTPRVAGQPVALRSSIQTVGGDGSPSSPGLFTYSTPYGISVGDCTGENSFLAYSPALTVPPLNGDRTVDIPLTAVDVPLDFVQGVTAGTHFDVWLQRSAGGGCTTTVLYPGVTSTRRTSDNMEHAVIPVPPGTYDLCAHYRRASDGVDFNKQFTDAPSAFTVSAPTSATANPPPLVLATATVNNKNSNKGVCPS